jgi:hypothetical protein
VFFLAVHGHLKDADYSRNGSEKHSGFFAYVWPGAVWVMPPALITPPQARWQDWTFTLLGIALLGIGFFLIWHGLQIGNDWFSASVVLGSIGIACAIAGGLMIVRHGGNL